MLQKGISNLIVDLLISLIVIGTFTAILAVTTRITNNVKDYVSQSSENTSSVRSCVFGWLIVGNESQGELVIGNPFNYSVTVAVLVNGLKKYAFHVGRYGLLEINNVGSNASDLMIVGPHGCISKVREVILP